LYSIHKKICHCSKFTISWSEAWSGLLINRPGRFKALKDVRRTQNTAYNSVRAVSHLGFGP
jgi:hypothetical protein